MYEFYVIIESEGLSKMVGFHDYLTATIYFNQVDLQPDISCHFVTVNGIRYGE